MEVIIFKIEVVKGSLARTHFEGAVFNLCFNYKNDPNKKIIRFLQTVTAAPFFFLPCQMIQNPSSLSWLPCEVQMVDVGQRCEDGNEEGVLLTIHLLPSKSTFSWEPAL